MRRLHRKRVVSQMGAADAKYDRTLSNRLPGNFLFKQLWLVCGWLVNTVHNNKSHTIRMRKKVFDAPSMELVNGISPHVGFIYQTKFPQSRPRDRSFYSHASRIFYSFNELISYFIHKINKYLRKLFHFEKRINDFHWIKHYSSPAQRHRNHVKYECANGAQFVIFW